MKVAVYIGKNDATTGERLAGLLRSLEMGGCECYMVDGELSSGTDMVLSVGGDGTFLSVSKLVADSGIPVVGVNMAVFNLLPVPALDGSKVVFCLIEWIRKKPINRKVETIIHFIGILVLFGFAILVDILQFI